MKFPSADARPLATLLVAACSAAVVVSMPQAAIAAPCETTLPDAVTGSLNAPTSDSLSQAIGMVPMQITPWRTTSADRIPQLEGRTQVVQMVTGRTSPNDTLNRFGVSGTDLGIPWDNGAGQTLVAFGDTMGNCLGNAQWRSNVLFRSADGNLADGMNLDSAPMERPGMARSVLPRSGMPGERTVIPTAGVSVGGKQYMRYMSVVDWGTPGVWKTNYSGLAVSVDNGESWGALPQTFRVGAWAIQGATAPAGAPMMPDWQMSAFLKHDGFVYEYATPPGRDGTARLARVPEAAIEDPAQYRYFDGKDWVPDPAAAVPVLDGKVSELSVQWNAYLGRFVAMYTDAGNSIVMRQADRPEGPWSGPQTIVPAALMPSMYGAFMHP